MIAFPIVLMSTVSTILVSVLVPVFAIALLVGVFLFLRRKAVSGYEKMVSDYESYHGQLTSSCKNMVNRLKSLGEYSPSFQKSYEERSKQYEDILERRDKNLRQSLESLSQLREGKNFKAFKGLLSQTQISLNDYEKAVSNFNEDLTSLLRDDIDTRDSSLQSKNMLRRIRDFYSEHEDDLRSLKESFELLFENAESTFATFEDDVNQAKFKEARDLLPKISSVLSAVLAILGDLPSLVTRVEKVIPESLKEAARIDGANRPQTLFRIVLPLARPSIIVTSILVFINCWNEYLFASTFTTGEELYTLASGLYALQSNNLARNWPQFAAASLFVSLPVLVVFFSMQRFMVSGLTAGGVKE